MFKILSKCKGGGYHYCRTDPPHPRRNSRGLYPHHIVVLENKLGRLLLPGEHAHHINEDKNDDSPENLEVKSKSEHARHHALAKAPSPIVTNCRQCGKEFEVKPHTFRLRTKRNVGGEIFCSLKCSGHFYSKNDIRGIRAPVEPIALKCHKCGADFYLLPGLLRARQKKNKGGDLFCSRTCAGH